MTDIDALSRNWLAEDVARMAVLNLVQIVEGAEFLLGSDEPAAFRRGVLEMTARTCFPTTFTDDPGAALHMVSELRDAIRKSRERERG